MENIPELKKLLEIAERAARDTGAVLRAGGDRSVSLSTTTDVKLAADVNSEKLVRERLAATGLPLFGEELGGDPALYDSPGTLYWKRRAADNPYDKF